MMTQQTPAPGTAGNDLSQTFIRFALDAGVLSFGEFVTKAGRKSPYFFNAGLFNQGGMLGQVAQFYAKTLLASGVQFDVLFGPAYKGITLASATAVALAGMGRDVGFAYNRKEAKDHGEGGTLVGAKLQGKVVIVDDVISAGTSVRESVNLIRAAGAEPAAVLIALDRMEKSGTAEQVGTHSAVQDVQREFGIPVIAIASLKDLLAYLDASQDPALGASREAVAAYRQRYGV
ncbi:orotate phosphoribosyltransferase [Cupriavidus taiwanensis LMG 19424]|uniref:Orotate phosphoribosyltransferase n=2 Tax=Cupriavidus taiwanensis TaxID=164546 RepID=B2AGE2_CUPTR|nr:orotate phosphoribosyltransferase [Cupriavidus taiwanensis LMG 19424]SOY53858.1 orotate phosphoribosyltransferase [Cupriavidus taiwanensis]